MTILGSQVDVAAVQRRTIATASLLAEEVFGSERQAGLAQTFQVLGAAMLGSSTAANSAARYAATDLAPVATRARALSVVVWATTIGAVAGPNLTGLSASVADRLGIPELTGPFALVSVGMLAAALVVAVLLRPDPLLTTRTAAPAVGVLLAAVYAGRHPEQVLP